MANTTDIANVSAREDGFFLITPAQATEWRAEAAAVRAANFNPNTCRNAARWLDEADYEGAILRGQERRDEADGI